MKQVEDDSFEGEQQRNVGGEGSAYTFFSLLCFLVAIIFLSIFLNNALDGLSKMLVLLGVIASGFAGVYLLEHRPTRKQTADEEENTVSRMPNNQPDDEDASIVDGALIDSVLVRAENDDDGDDEDDEDDGEQGEAGYDEEEGGEYEEDDGENASGDDEEDEQSLNAFKRLVEEALDAIPLEFRERMENLVILVEPEARQEVLARVGSKEGYILLGLYEGTPLTAQSYGSITLPERITIYQRTIEAYCHADPQRIRQQVRKTVLHEVAHHFGIDHDEMPIWVK